MRRCARVIAILGAAAACKGGTTTGRSDPSELPAPAAAIADAAPAVDAAAPLTPTASATCERLPFAESTSVPEASGAAWLTIDGKLVLVVVGDSGNHGAYGLVDPETGATTETGALPLSTEASDDIEGLAARGDRVFGLTSSGWIREWQRKGKAFELVGKPYPLGPVDLPDTKHNDSPPAGDGMVCNGRALNCGRNYEGLCLAPTPRGDCVGYAASKADGHLYCLTEEAGKLVVHHDRAIEITKPGALADCAFGDDGTLWAGSNWFDLGNVYRIVHWRSWAPAGVERVGSLAIGFPETIAARGDIVYRMSDMGGSPSLMAKYRCRP